MNFLRIILTFLTFAGFKQVSGSDDEVLNILKTAKDLTNQEVNALRPLFVELQKQCDIITKALENEGENDIVSWQKELSPLTSKEALVDDLESILVLPKDLTAMKYDTKLPSLEELIGNATINKADLTKEQLAELEDMQQIFQETLDGAQSNINDLVRRAVLIESKLLKINKPEIITTIGKALSVVFRYSTRLRRAAYCVYSHVPELNESLQHINTGVECYKYTAKLVMRVQKQTVDTVNIIRRDVLDLADVYRKVAAKGSLFGKIATIVMNLLRIARDVSETYFMAMIALDDAENKLPAAVDKTIKCGTEVLATLPQILTTAINVTTCISYDEPAYAEYPFLLPEAERDLHFVLYDVLYDHLTDNSKMGKICSGGVVTPTIDQKQ